MLSYVLTVLRLNAPSVDFLSGRIRARRQTPAIATVLCAFSTLEYFIE